MSHDSDKALSSPGQTMGLNNCCDAGKPKLLDQVRGVIRMKHYSIRTEATYIEWIKRYIYFHGKKHPGEMDVTAHF